MDKFYTSLFKCSFGFGGHSVVSILASKFEYEDPQNLDSIYLSWPQLSEVFFKWWSAVLWAEKELCQETVEKKVFLAAV